MKVTGIIAEYNPFHEGHAYQLQYAKSFSDFVIIVMSGSFVQRGDVAIYDKFKRTKVALSYGADLVLELPVVFSSNTAERFAFGGVSLLNSLGIVDYLLFGSESGDIKKLLNAGSLLAKEPDEISEKIRSLLKEGMSFPKAREIAYSALIDSSLLSEPNNILGLEYIKQLIKLNSKIEPRTIKRKGSGYHDTEIDRDFPSATAIRASVLNDGYNYKLFEDADIHTLKNLETAIILNIRKNKENAFSNIFDVSEGIENRLIKAALKYHRLDDIIEFCVTKRYTKTKIRRLLIASLLGLDANLSSESPQYIRVLGSTEKGFSLLHRIKENSSVPIITKTADFKEDNPMFSKDILSTDIYDLSSEKPSGSGQDFIKTPIILRSKS